MASRKRRYTNFKEDDAFETEAFQFLNEPKSTASKNKERSLDEAESDVELSGTDESDADEGKNLLDESKRLSADDDDDAPDSVGFADSKQTVMQQFRQAMDQIELEKQAKKEKRKKLDAQFKEQKTQRLKQLSETKLPEEFLQSLDSEIPKKKKKSSESKRKLKQANRSEHSNFALEDTEVLEDSSPLLDIGSDFIPLSGKVDRVSGVEVVKLGNKVKAKSAADSAAEFLKDRLYGGHIPRESTKQQMSKEIKRKARFR